ncbi:hypothetical protein BH09PLA1_BH09PLA1_19150 [soil metagenome]
MFQLRPVRIIPSVVALLCCCAVARAQTTRPADEVNLLAVADWGMNNANQKLVAAAIANHARNAGRTFSGALCGGDNLYVQPKSVDDPLWLQVFERMYDPAAIDFPFYISPGNHDYEAGKLAMELEYSRRNPTSRWKFPATFYRIDLPAGAQRPLVSVLMLDSNKDRMGEHVWQAQLSWLERELASPRDGTWMIAVAHHPLFSNGDHGDNGVLQTSWGNLFKRYGLDLFIAGHDHDLQHLEMADWKTSFILVGGGGATTRQMRVDRRGPFSRASYGFADLQFSPDKFTVTFVDAQNQSLHSFERNKSGGVRIVQESASDSAVPRTPRSVNRPDLPATKP